MAKLLPQTREMLSPSPELESPTGGMAARLLQGRETVSTVLIESLRAIGLRHAFGMIGGAVVPFFDALCHADLDVVHCRHENGAVFAAIEASLAADAPALAFTTTGPGLTNALTGAVTARFEGAKLLLVSALTPTAKRGRYPIQESSTETFGGGSLYTPGGLFDYAVAVHDPQELPRIIRTLIRGFSSPRGFVAHVALPLPVQASPAPTVAVTVPRGDLAPSRATMDTVVAALRERFAIWVGYGARHSADKITALVDRLNAPVFSTPRGKGVFAEDDPRFLGVSGLGGHDDLAARLASARVERILVLGSRLGELSSSYDPGLVPRGGLVHVDLDPEVPGSAYPEDETLAVQAEIGEFLDALLERCDELGGPRAIAVEPRPAPPRLEPREHDRVRPQYLMQCLQARVVEGSDAVVLSETGNSLAWTNRYLRFSDPHRYRMSGMFCPMGHVSAGILGTVATGRRAVAVVGDGAFLMQNELSTAAAIGADAVWIVLNDARYGMCDQGLRCLGYPPTNLQFPEVDFLALARSMGADGVRVWREQQVADAIEWALRSRGPFVIDVIIDPDELAPVADRIASIYTQTSGECP
jgi:acetolactate synthase I/II/III large subunit